MHTNLVGYQPAYVLYCVGVDGRREDLSQPHEANSEDHLPWGDGSWLDEVPSLRQMLPAHLRRGFRGVDTRDGFQQQIVEVSPKGGTLVLFDSVAVPHEVAPTQWRVIGSLCLAISMRISKSRGLGWTSRETGIRFGGGHTTEMTRSRITSAD